MANEKRLIDANAFCKSTAFICGGSALDPYWNGYADALDRVEEVLEQQPTVDAVELVHGHWTAKDIINRKAGYGQRYYYHEECKGNACQLFECPYDYCPNCGAKMDGDGNG